MSSITETKPQTRPLNLAFILAVLAGFIFYAYEYILRIIPSVIAPELGSYMHINISTFGAISAYYYYSYTMLQLVVGIILDRYDVRNALTLSALTCVLGTVLIMVSHNEAVYMIGRFIQGCGSAFAWIGILKLVAIYIPGEFYALATSFGAVFGFVGVAFGQTVVSFMTTTYGSDITLLIIIFAGLIIAYFMFNEIGRANLRLQQSQANTSDDTRNNAYNNAQIKKNAGFKFWYKLILIVFKKPYIWAAGIIAALLFTPTAVFAELWGVAYITKFYHYSDVQASFVSSMIFAGWALGSAMSGALSVFIANRVKLIRYGALGAFILSWVILYIPLSFEMFCFTSILFGMLSSVEVLAFSMGKEVVPNKIAGMAGAAINFMCVLLGVCFQQVCGKLLDLFWNGQYSTTGIKIFSLNSYKLAMLVIPLVLFICFLFTYMLDDKNKKIVGFRRIFSLFRLNVSKLKNLKQRLLKA